MRIAEQIVARGTNIEHTAATQREVFVLAAVTEPGDSGAPVVDQTGKVLGVLFAFDLSRPTTAYALTSNELNAVLDPVLSSSHHQSVTTGPCLSGEKEGGAGSPAALVSHRAVGAESGQGAALEEEAPQATRRPNQGAESGRSPKSDSAARPEPKAAGEPMPER